MAGVTTSPIIRKWVALAVLLALVFAVSAFGSYFTLPKIPTWYAGLVKPSFTPPNAVFPVAWTILYALMALSLWRLWEARTSPARSRAFALSGAQLVVNLSWSWVFFGAQSIGGGLATILALDALVLAALLASWRVDRIAGASLAPYLGWILFATALNAAIWRLNA